MPRIFFCILILTFLPFYGLNYIACNAGNSEDYRQCISELRKEVKSRIGKSSLKYKTPFSDAKAILNKLEKHKDKLNENEFAEKIIGYIHTHRTRMDSLIENHNIYFRLMGMRSESIKKDKHNLREVFDRGIEPDLWQIHADFKTLAENQLNPESTSENRHTNYFSNDATVLLYTISSLGRGFFGEKPKMILIKKIEEPSTVDFYKNNTNPEKNFFTDTKFGKIIKRLEAEIGLTLEDKKIPDTFEEYDNHFSVKINLAVPVEATIPKCNLL